MDKKIDLGLEGMDGNAFAIMGAFSKQARREGWTKEEIAEVIQESSKGDYNHLLQTIIAHTN